MPIPPSHLKVMLRDIVTALTQHRVSHALVGGMAVAAHGLPRATKDIDFLVSQADAIAAEQALQSLGFTAEVRTGGFIRFVRRPLHDLPELEEWADVLLARHAIGLTLLRQAQTNPLQWEDGLKVPIITVEGLIIMKVLAAVDDPSRMQDRADVIALMRLHHGTVDTDWLESAAAQLGEPVAGMFQQLKEEAAHETRQRTPNHGL